MKVTLDANESDRVGWVSVGLHDGAEFNLEIGEFIRRYGAQVENLRLGSLLTGDPTAAAREIALLRSLNSALSAGAIVTAASPADTELGQAIVVLFEAAGLTNVTDGIEITGVAFGVAPSDHVEPLPNWEEIQATVAAEVGGEANLLSSNITTHELLLRRVELLRQALTKESERRALAEQQHSDVVTQIYRERAEYAQANGDEPEPGSGLDDGSPAMLPTNSPINPPAPKATRTAVSAVAVEPLGRKARVRQLAAKRLPEGSGRREFAKAALDTYRETVHFGQRVKAQWRQRSVTAGRSLPTKIGYDAWLAGHRVQPDQIEAQAVWSQSVVNPPSIAVLILPGGGNLGTTVQSLKGQSWSRWTAAVCRPAADAGFGDDRVTAVSGNTIYQAGNAYVAQSSAQFVIVLREGDTLEPDCMFTIVSAVRQDPLVDIVVWDDDVVAGNGERSAPHFRPSWSPEMLLGADYVGSACAVKRRTFLQVGGLDDAHGPHAWWSVLLGTDIADERVLRVSRVLSSVAARGQVTPAATAMVQQHLDRRGLAAKAELVGQVVHIKWNLDNAPHVTVVIPTRHNRKMLSTCLPSLKKTDYPSFDLVIVDNGGQSASNDAWYADMLQGLDAKVMWWTEQPFNYSAVNNAGARAGKAGPDDVYVFLNDDTDLLDPRWMQELVGWATRPEIGVAGLQLIGPDDEIQHTGVILGLGGLADHVFEGTKPHEDSIFGRNDWYRNTLAVTGACMAMRHSVFSSIGGLDERFILCGSDVTLGLDTILRGYRNICSPFGTIRHLESATRGSNVPAWDVFMSFWRYNAWLFGGDPYFSPNVSLAARIPQLRTAAEPTPQQRMSLPLGRSFEAFKQKNDEAESRMLADICRAMPIDESAVNKLHADNAEPFAIETINWFLPDIDSPFYGGINTALRMANELAEKHGVRNRFIVWSSPNENFVRSALAAAFPALQHCELVFYSSPDAGSLENVPYADVSIATLWVTAYAVAHFANTKRKFYLIQDFDPMFYPASTLYALTEETYSLGLYGLCNTDNLRKIYQDDYQGKGMSFTPAVDPDIFHARGRQEREIDEPTTVFVYARPGHWRNCWEMTSLVLEELKARLGDRVRIVTAGAWAQGGGAEMDIKRLGLLDYRATGELYRHCDVGLALTVSKHPSYLPLELMACGVPVVAFDNPWGYWVLEDGVNSLLAKRTVDSLVDRLEKLCVDTELRKRMQKNALQTITNNHSDWSAAFADIYPYLCDPEGRSQAALTGQ